MTGPRAVTLEIPVEEFVAGDVLVLPSWRRVEVERVDVYGDEFVVRWCAGGTYRWPHPLEGQHVELGSLVPRRVGEIVPVDRRAE